MSAPLPCLISCGDEGVVKASPRPNMDKTQLTDYSEFKEFELSGWEKRAETYLARTENLTEPIMAKIVKQLKIEPEKAARGSK